MQTTPPLRATRFAQLSPGDLFILQSCEASCVALVVEDDTQSEPQRLALPIGPTLPRYLTYPIPMPDLGVTVTSFGPDFCLQWPTEPDAWSEEEPPIAVTAMALADHGPFLRCNFSNLPNHFQACFVDLTTGKICSEGKGASGRYIRPPGTRAYATRWAFLTLERRPRTILSYPFGTERNVS